MTTDKLLLIRIPGWVRRESITVQVNGQNAPTQIMDGFLQVETDGKPVCVELSYDLPVKEIVETSNKVDYRIRFEGDEIIGISPNTDFYPMYPDLADGFLTSLRQ